MRAKKTGIYEPIASETPDPLNIHAMYGREYVRGFPLFPGKRIFFQLTFFPHLGVKKTPEKIKIKVSGLSDDTVKIVAGREG